jgi:hypothetical protein
MCIYSKTLKSFPQVTKIGNIPISIIAFIMNIISAPKKMGSVGIRHFFNRGGCEYLGISWEHDPTLLGSLISIYYIYLIKK